jgi:PHD/YefM family antitoxin component YafN of YafNO toxin-antitoxin module
MPAGEERAMSAAVIIPLPPASAADPLAAAAARAERDRERLILTREGKPVAAIVPIEDLEALEAWEDDQDSQLAAEAIAQWEAEGRPPGIPLEDVARDLGIDLTDDPDAVP